MSYLNGRTVGSFALGFVYVMPVDRVSLISLIMFFYFSFRVFPPFGVLGIFLLPWLLF